MADLTGGPSGTLEQSPVDDDAGADPGRELQVDEPGRVASGAPDRLGQCPEVGVVAKPYLHAEALRHELGGVRPGPAGEDRGGSHDAAAMDGAGQAHPHAEN